MTIEQTVNPDPGEQAERNADGTLTQHPIGKEGVDPYESDAEWLDTGGYEKAVQEDIAYSRENSGR